MSVKNNTPEESCRSNNEIELGQDYWNNQYSSNTTGWDLGQVSPPIKEYIDQLSNKEYRILIPGCGNTYEVDKEFQQQGPPFGGNKSQYISLFENNFDVKLLEPCFNSFIKRQGTELFIILHRK